MRALRILHHGAFNPEDVQRLQNAFETAWNSLGPSIEKGVQPKARETLATVVVSAGNVSSLDEGELATVALRLFEAIWSGEQKT